MRTDTAEHITAETRRRVLVLAGAPQGPEIAGALRAEGFDVRESTDADAILETVAAFRPDLLLVAETLPTRGGRQVVLSIRASGASFGVPVVGLVTDVSVRNVLAWLRVGATDLWNHPFGDRVALRVRALIDECDRSRVQLGRLKVRLLAWVQRVHLSGTVTLHPGTPFEGRASFERGQLANAQFGSETGLQALEHMLELEDAPVLWEQTMTKAMVRAAATSSFKARVLVVEDDPALCTMLTKQLSAAHSVVESANDGLTGLRLALQKQWDVVVADLDLPKLDGWGLLRSLRADAVGREIAVLMLSAHDGKVETLKAAQSGARAYLKKSGRAKELLDAVALLAAPRAEVWDSLTSRQETRVELRSVGALWLLRTLAELDCQGRLELEDALGRYELTISQGQVLDLIAQTGSLRTVGPAALRSLIASRGEGRFVFSVREPPPGSRWLYEFLDDHREHTRKEEARRFDDAVSRPAKLLMNEELATLFAKLANVAELQVLETMRRAPPDLETVVAQTGLPRSDVELALGELLRRGVLTTE